MGPAGPIFAVYLATVLLTAMLSNGASITLMWPVARDVALAAGVGIKGPLYAVMVAASSDFSTPIGGSGGGWVGGWVGHAG